MDPAPLTPLRFARRWLPLAIWVVLLLVAGTGAGNPEVSGELLKTVLGWIFSAGTPALTESAHLFLRKVAHGVQFVILTALIWRAFYLRPRLAVSRRRLVTLVFAASATLAFASEGIQALTPGRQPSILDIGIDLSGTVVGLALMLAVTPWIERRARKLDPQLPEETTPRE